jgi:hypothetical protein
MVILFNRDRDHKGFALFYWANEHFV